MKAWPLLLAACVLSGCKYGSHLEAATAASKYVEDGGKSTEFYMGTDYQDVEVPNPDYERVLKANQTNRDRHAAEVAKCRQRKRYKNEEDRWNRWNNRGPTETPLSFGTYRTRVSRPTAKSLEEAKALDDAKHKTNIDLCIKSKDHMTSILYIKKLPTKTKIKRDPKKVQKTRQVDNISCLHEEELRQYVCVNRDEKKKYAYFKY